MQPPDVTNAAAEWEQIRWGKHPLWKNLTHQDVFSTDAGATFTISTERYDPDTPRPVHISRRV